MFSFADFAWDCPAVAADHVMPEASRSPRVQVNGELGFGLARLIMALTALSPPRFPPAKALDHRDPVKIDPSPSTNL